MKSIAHCDFETRSALELRDAGLWNYSRHSSTSAWCMAWAIGDEDVQLWTPGQDMPTALRDHVAQGGEVAAHNAAFELAIWNQVCVPRHGWPMLKPEQMACTMAAGYAMGLPGALEDVAVALGLQMLKDTDGRAIMLRFAKPWRADPLQWMDENPAFTVGGVKMSGAEGLQRLHEYNKQDVRVEREAYSRMMPLSSSERKVWAMDYAINQRGVKVDLVTAKAAVAMAARTKVDLDAEMSKTTGGAVQTCSSLLAMKEWMARLGVQCDSLAKQDVVDLLPMLESSANPNAALLVRALKLRQEAGKASTAKFEVMLDQAGADGRLRNMYQYHGANSGRWAGRQPQPHNMPRNMPKPAVVEDILGFVRAGDHRGIDMIYGPPLTQLSNCIRAFFTAEPDRTLVVGDWSSIEGRGQAWFSGEQWLLDAFVASDEKRGPGIYELAYARMFNVPVESVENPSEERQIGKVSVLACGYGGGVGSFQTMARTYGVKVADAKADDIKHAWRAAHPMIAASWREVEHAALSAVRAPGKPFSCGHHGRQATYKMVGSFLWCLLPSGRAICYPFPKIMPGLYGDQLTYMKVPDPNKPEKIVNDKANAPRWARVATWGGTLYNNIVQGFASDLLRHGLLTFHELGAWIVLHTHDDIALDVQREKAGAVRDFMEGVMCTPPTWAAGFPLHSKPAIMDRYGK